MHMQSKTQHKYFIYMHECFYFYFKIWIFYKKKSIDTPLYEKLFPILFKLIKYQLKLISLQDQELTLYRSLPS